MFCALHFSEDLYGFFWIHFLLITASCSGAQGASVEPQMEIKDLKFSTDTDVIPIYRASLIKSQNEYSFLMYTLLN